MDEKFLEKDLSSMSAEDVTSYVQQLQNYGHELRNENKTYRLKSKDVQEQLETKLEAEAEAKAIKEKELEQKLLDERKYKELTETKESKIANLTKEIESLTVFKQKYEEIQEKNDQFRLKRLSLIPKDKQEIYKDATLEIINDYIDSKLSHSPGSETSLNSGEKDIQNFSYEQLNELALQSDQGKMMVKKELQKRARNNL